MKFPGALACTALVGYAAAGPALEKVLQMRDDEPEILAQAIQESPLAAIAEFSDLATMQQLSSSIKGKADGVPIVFAHGMGDSCFNAGMQNIAANAGAHAGVYSVCVPNGNGRIMDMINGFLMNMNDAVDDFAERIAADPELADGFTCIGLSQGNSLCRGYAERHNLKGPVERAHISIHGTISGVAAFPMCDPEGGIIGVVCSALSEVLGLLAYNPLVQGILYQADYLRIPSQVNGDAYMSHSQIGGWNNEGYEVNEDYKAGFLMVEQHVLVKAQRDTMVFPNEGMWYGQYDDDFNQILPMNETRSYQEDLFGLRTADQRGAFIKIATPGGHLSFATSELYSWIDLLDVYRN